LLRRPVPPRRCDQALYQRRRHQRWGAAAEEDRPQRVPLGRPRLMRHVGEQRRFPDLGIDAGAHMAVEVAIGAFLQAERPVNVERQRHAFVQHGSGLACQALAAVCWVSLQSGAASPAGSVGDYLRCRTVGRTTRISPSSSMSGRQALRVAFMRQADWFWAAAKSGANCAVDRA